MDLKELLGEELAKQVQEKLGDKKLILNDGSYIPRERLNEKNKELEKLQKQLDETKNLIKSLSQKGEVADKITKELEDYKSKIKEMEKQYKEELSKLKIDAEVDKMLVKEKARNLKAVKVLLDLPNDLTPETASTVVEAKIKELKEKEPYLFIDDKNTPPDYRVSGKQKFEGQNPYKKETFNLTEQIRLERENPELAKQLKSEVGLT